MSTIHIDDDTILAVLAEYRGARACLDAAEAARSAIDGVTTIAALHVRVDPLTDILPTEEILTRDQQHAMELEAAREGQMLHDVYAAWLVGLDRHVFSNWQEVVGGEAAKVAEFGKVARLSVMVNLSDESRGHARTAFHSCLFATGKPFLIVPEQYERHEVRRMLIAWKDTAPCRRALDAAAPWLRRADDVLVARIGDDRRTEMEWVHQYLTDLGVKSRTRSVPRNGDLSVGQQVLDEAADFEADWIVAGAFHHGEIMEWLLGGVTETFLQEATIPLFLMH